ncbi:NACHT domain-containing protein [Lentzea sp. NPDC054927]
MRKWSIGRVVAVVGGLAAIGCTWWLLQISTRGAEIANIIALPVAAVSVVAGILALKPFSIRDASRSATIWPADVVSEALDRLAEQVKFQWEDEEASRRLHDPHPLNVRVSAAARELGDHSQVVFLDRNKRRPAALNGDLATISEVFERVSTGRAVLIGASGSGKTVLAMRLTLALLEKRPKDASGGGVPVLFHMATWDPAECSLRRWMESELRRNYAHLNLTSPQGESLAARLLRTGQIVPVLDGMDEVAESARIDAVRAINAYLRPAQRIFVTCRYKEYLDVIARGDVITGAAVLRVDALKLDESIRYLKLTSRSEAESQSKWTDLNTELRQVSPPMIVEALKIVLSSPLMLSLMRVVYSESDRNPGELLQQPPKYRSVTECVRAIEESLLDLYIPAVISTASFAGGNDHRQTLPSNSHYFTYLAKHLSSLGTYNIAWWELYRAIGKPIFGLVIGLTLGLPIFALAVVDALLPTWPWQEAPRLILISGGIFSLSAAIGVGLLTAHGFHVRPALIKPSLRRRSLVEIYRVGVEALRGKLVVMSWIGAFELGGIALGVMSYQLTGRPEAFIVGPVGSGVIAVGMLGAVVFVLGLNEPVDLNAAASPTRVLALDKVKAISQGISLGAAGATMFWGVGSFCFYPLFGVSMWLVFSWPVFFALWALTILVGATVWVTLFSAWGMFWVASRWLAFQGRLPGDSMSMFQHAHRLGILRISGPMYQFRHARLQDRLTDSSP